MINLEKLNNKKVAIYGIGNNARDFYKSVKSLNIEFFIAKDNIGEIFLDGEIVSIEEAVNRNVEVIIVAAEIETTKVIYDRIKDICTKNHISLYGIYVGDLMVAFGEGLYGLDENVDIQFIKDRIDEAQIVTFDIFDTLLMRKTLQPADIFDIVAAKAQKLGILVDDYKLKRIRAELNVFSSCHKFESIYRELAEIASLSSRVTEDLMRLEKETELECIIARDDVKELFNYALTEGKDIYLVSDMYHSKEFLVQLLNKNNVTGYKDIFISGYEGCSKSDGLFFIVKKAIGDKKILHIGDNKIADGLAPRVCDIKSILIKRSIDITKGLSVGDIISTLQDPISRLFLGIHISKCMNSPFGENQYKVKSMQEYCDLFISPFVTGFIFWLLKQLKKSCYDKILFCARDGYLFKKLYDMAVEKMDLHDMPESIYFYCSRQACLNALKCEGERQKFSKYIKNLGLSKTGKYAFVDFISSGTSLLALQNMFFDDITGLFFVHYLGTERAFYAIEAMYEESIVTDFHFQGDSNLITEMFITSLDPSVKCFDSLGGVVFKEEIRSDRQIKAVKDSQDIITNYFEKFMFLANEGSDVMPMVCNYLWKARKDKFFDLDIHMFDSMVADDSLNDINMNFYSQI